MSTPRILAIGGSDPSGGAGIQADIKTITMLGGYAMAAITAVTVQNTLGVSAANPLPAALVLEQIDACLGDIGADAVKIGMLGSGETARAVAERLARFHGPVVFDPVMVATSGGVLAGEEVVAAFEARIARATLTTPNLPELASLAGLATIATELEMADAAEAVMLRTGARAILAKGGHWPGGMMRGKTIDGEVWQAGTDDFVFDCLYCLTGGDWREWTFHHPRINTRHTHGTGCTLASAIATGLGAGLALEAAVARGIAFVQATLKAAPGFGQGQGPLGHHALGGWMGDGDEQ